MSRKKSQVSAAVKTVQSAPKPLTKDEIEKATALLTGHLRNGMLPAQIEQMMRDVLKS